MWSPAAPPNRKPVSATAPIQGKLPYPWLLLCVHIVESQGSIFRTGAFYHSRVPLWDWHSIEDLLNDCIGCYCLRLGFVAQDETMAQHVRADAFDVLRRYISPALKQRPRFRRHREVNRCSRRSP